MVQCSHRMGLAFHAIAESFGGESRRPPRTQAAYRGLSAFRPRAKDFGGVRAVYLQDSYTPYTQLILSDPSGSRVFLSSG